MPFSGAPCGFFEDAPQIDEMFEDWLTWERAYRCSASAQNSADGLATLWRPCVVINPPRAVVDDPYVVLVVQTLCDQLSHSLRLHGMVELFDRRDLESDQLIRFEGKGLPAPDFVVQTELVKAGGDARVSIRLHGAGGGSILWNASLMSEQTSKFLFSRRQLEEFSNSAADAIQFAILKAADGPGVPVGRAPRSIFGAVHQVLGMSVDGQRRARSFLRERAAAQDSSVAMAWYALSLANSIGEGDPRAELAASAEEYCRRAIELEPDNGLTLALVAHVYGFVLRRMDVGADLASRARRCAPTLALAWDLSAMNSLYAGRTAQALDYSMNARRLGEFSPYRAITDSSLAIAASVAGNHELALKTSEAVLLQCPNFLAVMRHRFGSLAAAERVDEARDVQRMILARDPRFLPNEIVAPDYPLPSAQSRELILEGLRKVG